MAIDKFLEEFRDYMYTKDMLLDEIDSSSSKSDLYVIVEYSNKILKELLQSSLFLDTSLIDIEKEILDIYSNIHLKLDKILQLAEGYQNLNTMEVLSEPINSFSIFDIKSNLNYNTFYEAITLKNIKKIKNKTADRIEKNNLNALEYYTFSEESLNQYIKLSLRDNDNTVLKRINTYDINNNMINSYSEITMIRLDKDIVRIEVITDNEDSDKPFYSQMDILEDFYQKHSTVTLKDVPFIKEGSLLKLNLDFELPTECYTTVKITLKYKDEVTEKLIQETVYTDITNSKSILVNKQELNSLGISYNKIENSSVIDPDLLLVETFSTNPNVFKEISYNVFDISKINTKEFSISLVLDIYSITDKNKTPKIKGIYGYVTK